MIQGAVQRSTFSFSATDIVVLGVHLFFAVVSAACIGRAVVEIGPIEIDRGLLGAVAFLGSGLLLPLVLPHLERARSPLLQALRVFYPQALYAWYFPECIYLSQLVTGGASFDPVFAQMDQALFGVQPAAVFAPALGLNPVVNELFFFSYFFYYALITTGFWLLFARGQRRRAARCVFIVTASFAILYVWYVFFPVHGPKYFIGELRESFYTEFEGFLFVPLMTRIFNNMSLAGAAFPSSHVAIGLIALILNARYNPRLARFYAPMTLLLAVSTVYIYAHYVVDVVAGIAFGLVLFTLVRRLYPLLSRLAARLTSRLRGGPVYGGLEERTPVQAGLGERSRAQENGNGSSGRSEDPDHDPRKQPLS
jgi:membrane-associated phospholipid phosphatase